MIATLNNEQVEAIDEIHKKIEKSLIENHIVHKEPVIPG